MLLIRTLKKVSYMKISVFIVNKIFYYYNKSFSSIEIKLKKKKSVWLFNRSLFARGDTHYVYNSVTQAGMRWLGWSNGRGLELEQEMVGGVKSQGRVSNNSSVSEARTRWPLALLLQAETFLFTADFNSLWTPALAWPCSGGKKWHPLLLPKNSEIFLPDRSRAVL